MKNIVNKKLSIVSDQLSVRVYRYFIDHACAFCRLITKYIHIENCYRNAMWDIITCNMTNRVLSFSYRFYILFLAFAISKVTLLGSQNVEWRDTSSRMCTNENSGIIFFHGGLVKIQVLYRSTAPNTTIFIFFSFSSYLYRCICVSCEVINGGNLADTANIFRQRLNFEIFSFGQELLRTRIKMTTTVLRLQG